jgi:heme-degrading monooxygenase HmoA
VTDWGKKAIKCKQKFHVCSMFILFYLTNLVQFKKWEKTEKDKNKKKELEKMRVRAEKQLRIYFVHENKLMALCLLH